MLKRTPRSGFQFLSSGAESVAEHIFRTTCIGYALGNLTQGVKSERVIKMCLFHDLPEARTGDLNYVNKKYVEVDEEKAVKDLSLTVPFGGELKQLILEFNEGKTVESRLARDADQIEMILALKEYKELGNKYAEEWIGFMLKRLQTEAAQELAKAILETDYSHWWFGEKGEWWVKGGKE